MFPSPDANIFRFDKAKQRSPIKAGEGALLEKYVNRLEEYRIKMNDFSDIYTPEEISNDKKEIEILKANDIEPTERSRLAEGIVCELAELHN